MISKTLQAIGEQYAAYAAAVDRAQNLLAQEKRTPAEEHELSTVVARLGSDSRTRDLLAAEQRRVLEHVLEKMARSASPADGATGTMYNDVIFEPRAAYNGDDKQLLTFDQSLERLINAGHKRHPHPAEAFSLLIAGLENKLTSQQKAVADDMLTSYGEWLSAAVERKGDTLTVYFDPQGLVFNSSAHTTKNFTCSEKRDFPLATGIPSSTLVDLARFSTELVTTLYSRSFQQLPQKMREGEGKAQLYLPPDGIIRHVGRGFGGRFDFDGGYYAVASRGCSPVVGGAKKTQSTGPR